MKSSALPLALAGIAGLAAGPAFGQNANQVWTGAFASGPVKENSRMLVWIDAHARFNGEGDQLNTTILRPGIGWRVSPRLDVWAGYAHITLHRPGPDGQEHRAWQQATYPVAEIAGGRLTGRTRLEQRFREGGDETGWRLRQFMRWSRPIAGPELTLVASNETFIAFNDTDWGQNSGYDQNRAFVGVGWQVTPKFRLEGGYMNQQIDGGSGPDRRNDNFVLNGFATF
ncbi:DUF2490 domain-containing protein [Rhizobium sp. CRIBSB]|nr:DUF2490 domain-containing protein [Rhizobium sp. CRIBSB]